MNTIKSFIGWIKPRWLRLAIGVLFMSYAFSKNDSLLGFFGVMIFMQGVLNMSCGGRCGPSGCDLPQSKANTDTIK